MPNKNNKKNLITAFSLIEISVIMLIISVMIAGLLQGGDLVYRMRLNSARAITEKSPVPNIENLQAWFEPTMPNVFTSLGSLIEFVDTDLVIEKWQNLNPQINSSLKSNATQSTSANQPTVKIDKYKTGLPMVRFDNNKFMNLNNGTVPYGNSPYTIFIVSKLDSFCTCGILGSGTYGTNKNTNAFRYSVDGKYNNYWWGASSGFDFITDAVVKSQTLQLATFEYDNVNRYFYLNGVFSSQLASSNNLSTALNNTIGVTNSTEYLIGSIAEIIIYSTDLRDNDRKLVENYLIEKWGIK